jgi:tetratricopeptide (TPR) repeat protein
MPSAFLSGLLVASTAFACLWDYDTLKMERTRFPDTLELITGKFLRHSPEFYQWRIKNRLYRLESDPTNVNLLDDLAVAYDKTGQHEKAIESALQIETIQPGRYETAANLGTFYIHGGKPKERLPHIERALRINPDAHFGREKYQKLLVEYVLVRRPEGPTRLPLADVKISGIAGESATAGDVSIAETFEGFLHRDRRELVTTEEIAAEVKGLLGMIKFGNHNSPILFEALGSVLLQRGYEPGQDAKLLAARSFLRASFEAPDEPARTAYRALATRAIQMQTTGRDRPTQITLDQVEAAFNKELHDAKAWYAELRDRELFWIRDGLDPEAEFDRLYTVSPESPGVEIEDPTPRQELFSRFLIKDWVAFGTVALALTVSLIVIRSRIRTHPRTPAARRAD